MRDKDLETEYMLEQIDFILEHLDKLDDSTLDKLHFDVQTEIWERNNAQERNMEVVNEHD